MIALPLNENLLKNLEEFFPSLLQRPEVCQSHPDQKTVGLAHCATIQAQKATS